MTAGGGAGTVNSGTAGSVAFYSAAGAIVSGSADIYISSGNGVTINPLTNSTSTTTGALVVSGGVGVGGTISIGQRLTVGSSLNASSTTTGAIVNSGGLGLAGNAFIGGTVNIQNASLGNTYNSGALVVAGDVGIGNSLFVQGKINNLYAGTDALNINNRFIVDTGSNIQASLTSNYSFAFVVRNLSNNNRFIVDIPNSRTLLQGNTVAHELRLHHTTNAIYTGFQAASSGATTYTLPAGSPATGSSVLQSTSAGVMSWVPLGVNSGTAGSVAFYATDGTAVSGSADLFISSGNGVTVNPATNSTSTTTGSLVVKGGAGIALSASIGGRLQLFSGANYSAFVSSATANTVYTLPATSPATGTSILQSTSAGVMSWTPYIAGFGTVNQKSISIFSPSTSDEITLMHTYEPITILQFETVNTGSGSALTYFVNYNSDRSSSIGTTVVLGGTAHTAGLAATTTGQAITTFTNASIGANQFIWLRIGSVTGTMNEFHFTMHYKKT